MIVHKNWHKYFAARAAYLLVALVLALSLPVTLQAAPKLISVKNITQFASEIDVELMVVTKNALITVRNSATQNTNIEVKAEDFTGTILWEKVIDSGSDEVATVIATDSTGNIWIGGNSSDNQSTESQTATSATTSTPLNPDGVLVEDFPILRSDMRQTTLWQLSPAGELVTTFTYTGGEISLVNALSINASGASFLLARESGFSLISSDLKGAFTKEVKIGSAKTTLTSILRSSDGSVSLFGSSSETLGGKKLVGREDGVLIKVSKAGAITNVVRSSAPKALRIWNTATNSLLLTGSVKTATTSESALTKFNSSFTPTWTTRIASTGRAIAANGAGGSFYVALEPTGAVKGLANFKATKGQSLVLNYDGKGVLIAAFSAADLKSIKQITFSQLGGLFILTDNAIFRVGATK